VAARRRPRPLDLGLLHELLLVASGGGTLFKVVGVTWTTYDPAYFEDLAGRLYSLVISFSDRPPADRVQRFGYGILFDFKYYNDGDGR
jgi:hypothetical protein